jgi:hypothetical protein
VFTARYASMMRSVTLDAAYPVSEQDPWYPHTIITARRAFRVACQRSVACHAAAPGSSWARIVRLAAYLRAHPVTGRTRDAYGQVITQRVGIGELIELVNNAGTDNIVYRELDPAARALLNGHDAVPLLRLAATDLYTGNSGPVRQFNDGLYQATTCLDYPQPFSYRAGPGDQDHFPQGALDGRHRGQRPCHLEHRQRPDDRVADGHRPGRPLGQNPAELPRLHSSPGRGDLRPLSRPPDPRQHAGAVSQHPVSRRAGCAGAPGSLG